MMSAAASLGLSLLWDTDLGLSHVDKYTYSEEEYIKVSQLMSSIVTLTYRDAGGRTTRYRYPQLWSAFRS